jgi:hypothetical protein
MMARKIIDTKIRTLIKAYLIFNKGRKVTASEIAEFINTNDFSLNQYNLHPIRVSHMINTAKLRKSNMLHDIQVEKIGGVNHFYL